MTVKLTISVHCIITSLLLFIFPVDGWMAQAPQYQNDSLEIAAVSEQLPDRNIFAGISFNWADSVFHSLTPEERIAQLFMVAAYSNKSDRHLDDISELVENHKVGGLIFFQGGPVRQARQCNYYQSIARTPLLISIDAEWGLSMRLDSTVEYPRQMMIGAVQDNRLVYEMGADIAEQSKRLGIHVNLAPVVDVNNNPENPVINSRSFGEDKYNVARKGVAYMKGMQDQRVLATAKHFPGHGDTDTDSHKALPIIKHTRSRLDNIELYPFRELIREGVGGVMVAHLFIPVLDSAKSLASTLSKPIVTGVLKEELQFKGLIFTDALNMKGVSAFYRPGEVDLKALLAGNDVLLFAEDVPLAIRKIKKAIERGEISQDEIDERCKKILRVKQWAGLDNYRPVKLDNLLEDLNAPAYEKTKRRLIASAITLLRNNNDLLPITRPDTLKIASLVIGDSKNNTFQQTLEQYGDVHFFSTDKDISKNTADQLFSRLDSFNLVIVSIHGTNENPYRNFGITSSSVNFIKQLRKRQKVVLNVFANAYGLNKLYGAESAEAVILSYEDSELAQNYSAQLIFGGIAARGKLPVTASPLFHAGMGIDTRIIRLQNTIPEDLGIRTKDLEKIDNIVLEGINAQAYPGCQVLVAKEGKIIFNKAYGHHTYEEKQTVKKDDIYDLASITKIASTLLAVMKLRDEGRINLDYNLCDYIPELVDTTEYMNINLREMLAHQAGLTSWIPFYYQTLSNGQPKYEIYSLAPSEIYSFRVAENLYINKEYKKEILRRILATPLNKEKEYKYSDLGYYLLQQIIEKITGQTLDEYVKENFYDPMGLSTMGYHPRNRFGLDRIVPTEYDMMFRKQLVHGDVHDPGAAMMGGVGGHAGLFSNAGDLAALMQMLLNWGEYGGIRYIDEETVKDCSRCQFCAEENRRGAGFDKPARNGGPGPTCDCISYESFGHSGFTGTIAWADPDEQVVFIFLSNRVYPDANNKKFIKMGIRTQVMQVIYDAISNAKEEELN